MQSKLREKRKKQEKKMLGQETGCTKMSGVLTAFRCWNANILCLSETQCAWENYLIGDRVSAELQRGDKCAGFVGSSSCKASADTYKPGGTATVFDGQWVKRITRGTDPHKLGRWSFITITGRNSSFLTVITGYRCCKNVNLKTKLGHNTTYMQQESILRSRGVSLTPQKAFIKDMEKFIRHKQGQGHEILLTLDANEQWEDKDSEIWEMAIKLHLFDIPKERHPEGVPATYNRVNTSRQIDLILGTEAVLETIMAYGIAPKGYKVLGDHRVQFVDIDIASLLHLNKHDNTCNGGRRLRSSGPKRVEVYCKKLNTNFNQHKINERIEKLWNEIRTNKIMTTKQIEAYEAIDQDVHRLCINAEKSITFKFNTRYIWSPALDEAIAEVLHWKARKSSYANTHKTRKLLEQAIIKGYRDKEDMSEAQIMTSLAKARLCLRNTQKHDIQRRQDYLISLAEKYAKDHNISKETAIKELLSHKEIREIYSKIRKHLKNGLSQQLSEVWIPLADGSKRILTTDEEMENHLLDRNWSHLRQAAPTPFAEGVYGKLINWDGTRDFADGIVEGRPLPEIQHESEVVQRYIEGMAAGDPALHDTVRVEISLEQYRSFWEKKRESTVTSPYRLHIGHYRSVLASEYEDILMVHHKLMIIPFKFAIIPTRWARTVQVLLGKDAGSPWSHRLRIIELIDSQVNDGLQMLIGKQMVHNALKQGQIHESAYGLVPNRTAQDAVMGKTLSLDMIRIQRSNGAILDCDAKGCYDRIVAPLQSVASRRLGVPKIVAIFFSRFWRLCEHHIRTKYGISKKAYGSTRELPLFGIGQGNGAGPAFWLSTLIVMFNVLDALCQGIVLSSPQGLRHKSSGFGYVDDVTLGSSSIPSTLTNNDDILISNAKDKTDVFSDLVKIGNAWESMLYTNGGRLELGKCFWLLVGWKWQKGIATIKSIGEIDKVLTIVQSEDGKMVTIPLISINEAPRVLGCYVAADGSWTRELGRWTTEATTMAAKIRKAKFSRVCGEKVYNTIWIPRLRYVAPVVCFTKSQCSMIDKKVVRQCLGAVGYNRNFPRAVVFGPHRLGGMGWETMSSLQIYEKVKFTLLHLRKQDKIGNMLRLAVAIIQLSAGIQDDVLATKVLWTKWMETCWISNLKQWLDEIDAALHITYSAPKPQRQYDRALMDIFSTWGLSAWDMKALNRVRIYLRVIYVSDVTSYDETTIEPQALEVTKIRDSSLVWPRQIKPVRADR